jgi:hypothetical protein
MIIKVENGSTLHIHISEKDLVESEHLLFRRNTWALYNCPLFFEAEEPTGWRAVTIGFGQAKGLVSRAHRPYDVTKAIRGCCSGIFARASTGQPVGDR